MLHYRRLRKHLPDGQPILGLQGQGLDGDAVTRKSVPVMARHYVSELVRSKPQGPFVLVGHCSGGLIAMEMAQQLQALGKQVAEVVVIDTKSPELRKQTRGSHRNRVDETLEDTEHEEPARERSWVQTVLNAFPYNAARRTYKWSLAMAAHCFTLLDKTVPIRLRSYYVISTNRRILQAYSPRPYQYDGNLAAVRTLKRIDLPADLGWSGYVRGRVRTATVNGEHMFLRKDHDALAEFARILRDSGKATVTAQTAEPQHTEHR